MCIRDQKASLKVFRLIVAAYLEDRGATAESNRRTNIYTSAPNFSFKSETIMRFSLLHYFLGLSRLIFGLKYEVNLQYLGSKIQRSVIDKQYPEGIGIPTPRLQQLVLSSAGDGSTPPSHVPHDIESEYGVYNNLGRRGARKTCFPSFCPSPFQHRYSGWPSRCETPRTR